MKSATELDAPMYSKQFFGLKLCFLEFKFKKAWYICLNLIDFSTRKVHFVYSKLNLRPKNNLLEIGASKSVADFIAGEYSSGQ